MNKYKFVRICKKYNFSLKKKRLREDVNWVLQKVNKVIISYNIFCILVPHRVARLQKRLQRAGNLNKYFCVAFFTSWTQTRLKTAFLPFFLQLCLNVYYWALLKNKSLKNMEKTLRRPDHRNIVLHDTW